MKHSEDCVLIKAEVASIFAYADDHANLSSHMAQSSWMMGGGRMEIKSDDGYGQRVGSHIRLSGKVLGMLIFLDEVVTIHKSPFFKTWETVGDIRLLVIGHYRMGFEIKPQRDHSSFRVFIDYDLPLVNAWLGRLFGGFYARWCVTQMINGARNHFLPK